VCVSRAYGGQFLAVLALFGGGEKEEGEEDRTPEASFPSVLEALGVGVLPAARIGRGLVRRDDEHGVPASPRG
jgi:hypothetical protein